MMKIKTLLAQTLIAGMLGVSATASAGFNFSNPFDWADNNNNDDYRYGAPGGRGGYQGDYGRDRWRQYDEWEPNYWRYRYFDDSSRDNLFDGFDGDGFGDGRGRFDFNMDMNMDTDSRFDGYNDYRGRGDYRNYDYDSRRDDRRYERSAPPRPAPTAPQSDRGRYGNDNADRYNDDYWRNYSQRYNSNDGRRR